MKKAIIVDIDNVLMDSRIPDLTQPDVKNDREAWREWYPTLIDCTKIDEMFTLINSMILNTDVKVFLVTSREAADSLLRITLAQVGGLVDMGAELIMRAEGDNRPSPVVKQGLYENVIKGRYKVLFAIDDLEENIEMFKKLGIKTLQFRYGDEN